jgi:hypothetical protein
MNQNLDRQKIGRNSGEKAILPQNDTTSIKLNNY